MCATPALSTPILADIPFPQKTFENLTMQMEWRTPLEKIDALENAMNDWLSKEENRWFQPATSVVLQNIQYQRYLEVTLGIGHNGYVHH